MMVLTLSSTIPVTPNPSLIQLCTAPQALVHYPRAVIFHEQIHKTSQKFLSALRTTPFSPLISFLEVDPEKDPHGALDYLRSGRFGAANMHTHA